MQNICYWYSKDEEDAKDLLQDGWAKVHENFSSCRNTTNPEGWLRRIFVNLSIDHYRKNQKKPDNIPLNFEPSSENTINENIFSIKQLIDEYQIDFQIIREQIELMPYTFRTTFSLYYLEKMKHDDIAKIMGITAKSSRANLSKAKTLLQKQLSQIINKRKNNKRYLLILLWPEKQWSTLLEDISGITRIPSTDILKYNNANIFTQKIIPILKHHYHTITLSTTIIIVSGTVFYYQNSKNKIPQSTKTEKTILQTQNMKAAPSFSNRTHSDKLFQKNKRLNSADSIRKIQENFYKTNHNTSVEKAETATATKNLIKANSSNNDHPNTTTPVILKTVPDNPHQKNQTTIKDSIDTTYIHKTVKVKRPIIINL